MRDFARDWNHAVARYTFKCALCGEVASHVALVPDQPAGRSDKGDWLVAESEFFGEWVQVVAQRATRSVAEALANGDAQALHDVDPLWAPFHCPECKASYCAKHWNIRLVFDEEWTSWYDYAVGTCPNGHERMVDD